MDVKNQLQDYYDLGTDVVGAQYATGMIAEDEIHNYILL
jgi:hypothetical protein